MWRQLREQYKNKLVFFWLRVLYGTFAVITLNLKKAVSALSFLTLKYQNKQSNLNILMLIYSRHFSAAAIDHSISHCQKP